MSSNTVTEKINFTPTHEIERALPALLADNGKMSLQIWNKFCDKIDDIVKPLARVSCLSSVMWAIVIVMIILMSTGWQFADFLAHYYGIMTPVTIVLLILLCKIETYFHKKVASQISRACASASNHDKDLTMTLEGFHPNKWYIEVTLRNVIDVENNIATEAVAIPVAAPAVPVASAVASSVASPVVPPVASPGPVSPPKKYIKDQAGKMTLNPEYKKWMESNQA